MRHSIDEVYLRNAKIMSSLSAPIRLQILDMLSCGELCASQIQNTFSITQPMTSYHMKQLMASGIVMMRNEGKYVYYSLNEVQIKNFLKEIQYIVSKIKK